jgi:hypothetical protein
MLQYKPLCVPSQVALEAGRLIFDMTGSSFNREYANPVDQLPKVREHRFPSSALMILIAWTGPETCHSPFPVGCTPYKCIILTGILTDPDRRSTLGNTSGSGGPPLVKRNG